MTNRRVAEDIMGWEWIPFGPWERDGRVSTGCWRDGSELWAETEWSPTTSLDHAKMAWDKLSVEQRSAALSHMAFGYVGEEDGWVAGYGAVLGIIADCLDPLKLCEAMLATKETT